jgi:hypothetical protein
LLYSATLAGVFPRLAWLLAAQARLSLCYPCSSPVSPDQGHVGKNQSEVLPPIPAPCLNHREIFQKNALKQLTFSYFIVK